MSISKIVNFTVLINPTIILQENANLETSSLALNFTVDHPVTSISYSLDGQAPTPISGNFTLSNLSNGQHNITVYTIDKATNITTSDTRCFYVQAPVQAPQN